MTDINNSLSKAIHLISSAKKQGIILFLEDNKLRMKVAKNSIVQPELMDQLKKYKESIFDILSTNSELNNSQAPIFKRNIDILDKIPLSFSQERLWFIDQLEGSTQYHIPSALRLIGELNVEALEFALLNMIRRHEILRTVIEKENGLPYQRILDANDWKCDFLKDEEHFYKKNPAELQSKIEQLLAIPYNLSKDYMLRATLIELDKNEYLLVVVIHHIVSDGWSLPIVVSEIMELYDSFIEKRNPLLPELSIQYADYAIWQRNHLSGDVLDKKIQYWKNKLENVTPLNLSTDFKRPFLHSNKGATCSFILNQQITAKLLIYSKEQNTTLFMTLLAAYKLLLYRYTGKKSICVGTPTAGRQNREVEALIGFFVNSLALNTEVSSNYSFNEFLSAVKQTTLEAYDHQEVSFEKIVETVVKDRDMSMTPLFQVVFALQNNEQATMKKGSLGGVKMIFEDFDQTTSKYDLNFSIEESEGRIVGSMEYCTDLYTKSTIDRMLVHYEELLTSIVSHPHQLIDRLEFLAESERLELSTVFGKNFDNLFKLPVLREIIDTYGESDSQGVQFLILDKNETITPIGVEGEICLKTTTGTVVKTGHIGRWLENGDLDYKGKETDFVMLRGHRILLPEIESELENSDLVSQAVVTAGFEGNELTHLIAYVVPGEEGFFRDGIVSFLRNKLPEYKVPSVLVELEYLPLDSKGNIDKTALPEPGIEAVVKNEYVAPSNELEEKLAVIWRNLLQLERHIGIHDNFFDMGGGSLLSMRLISSIRSVLQVEVAIKDMFFYNTISKLSNYISEHKHVALLPSITKQERPERIPLSFSQERLWFIDQLEGSVQYHIPSILRLKGNLNIEALTFAFNSIVNRHQVLRTIIGVHEGTPYQSILEENSWYLDQQEFTAPINDPEGFIENIIHVPFDLSKDHMLRCTLLHLSSGEYILVLVMHHIVSDGWSLPIIVNEFTELYDSFVKGRTADLLELPIQYSDFAIWQRNYLEGTILNQKMSYWKTKLENVLPLDLPTDYNRPSVHSTKGAVANYFIDKSLKDSLLQFSKSEEVTLFVTLLSAFNTLLYKYSGQDDICIGTPIAGRQQQELEGLIGFFINTLAIRNQIDGKTNFRELVQSVKTTVLDAFDHQEVPFEKIVEAVVKDRDMSRTPLFQVMFVMQNNEEAVIEQDDLGDLQLSHESYASPTSIFELNMSVWESANGLQLVLEYNTDLYSSSTIDRLLVHYEELLKSILSDASKSIDDLTILSTAESAQILDHFNATEVTYPLEKRVADFFEESVLKTPFSTAVVFNNESITYTDLNNKSNQLAHFLRAKGVGNNVLVPICIDRSIEMVIGLLGIYKAGGAYVPLDPSYPEDRIHYMLKDSGPKLVLSSRDCRAKLDESDVYEIIELDTDWDKIAMYTTENPERIKEGSFLGYVIYTSGSTGKPKGVSMPESGLVNLLFWHESKYGGEPHKVLQFASLNFDASFQEIFSAICFGGSVYLIDEENRKDMHFLLDQIEDNELEHLFIPYVVLKNLCEQGHEEKRYPRSLKTIFAAGEQLRLNEDIRLFCENTGVLLVNYYGPSETHVVTWYEVQEEDYQKRLLPPIGKPIANTEVYIKDKSGAICPVGVPGEVYLGGVQVATGYLNLETLSREKFLEDPYKTGTIAHVSAPLLYKTGDIGRWLPDGNIEFLGRADDQVKIRGNRVELGEVEAILEQSDLISQAVVLVKTDSSDYKYLAAYIVPMENYSKPSIEAYLKSHLPDYMIPSLFMELETFPITNNGKVNKRALPEFEFSKETRPYVAARNEQEHIISAIWQRLLNVEQIGVEDNFFETGGHSLLATRVISALRKELSISLSIRNIFLYPTISALSEYIDTLPKQEEQYPGLSKQVRPEKIPLSFAQERLWFIDQLEGSVHYHLPTVLRLKGNLNIEALEFSLKTIVNRHEVLRTVIRQDEKGKPYQYILNKDKWEIKSIDLGDQKNNEGNSQELKQVINDVISEPFDLSMDHMIRVNLLKQNHKENILVMVLHHIATDAWSMPILVNEMIEIYVSFIENRKPNLSDQTFNYADYAVWQQNHLTGNVLAQKMDYWALKLKDIEPLDFPLDYSRKKIKSTNGAFVSYSLDRDLKDKLKSLSQKEGATLFITLLSAFNILLNRYTGQDDIIIGTPIANRTREEVEGMIGFFVNTLVLRNKLSNNRSFVDLLQEIKETTLEAYEHQDTPFEKIVEAVVKERDTSLNPLFQIMFILQNNEEINTNKKELSELTLIPEKTGEITSKFDFTMSVTETKESLDIGVVYSKDIFTEQTMKKMIEHFEVLLRSIIKSPTSKIENLSLISLDEKKIMIETFNNNYLECQEEITLIDLIENQVEKTPNNSAVVFENTVLSYFELNQLANQIAKSLIEEHNVRIGDTIGLLMNRSEKIVPAILGIMKSGGVYVPIDPEYPEERINFMITDSQCKLVIDENKIAKMIDSNAKITNNIKQSLHSDNLAYIMYTSGSTGVPKGVMIEHRSLVNYILGIQYKHKLNLDFVFLSSICFDASLKQLFLPLINGKKVHVYNLIDNFNKLSAYIEDNQIRVLNATPGVINELVNSEKESALFTKLKSIIIGGETFEQNLISKLRRINPSISIINAYGPTEACANSVTGELINNIPNMIGTPLPNTIIYIMDKNIQIQPLGIPGEIYISGSGVARGYFNRPELTSENFGIDPYDTKKRYYKTGDIARWLPDGNIQFLGRKDSQVKIRGYRIELGEIENVLLEIASVKQAVVINNTNRKNILIAFVVTDIEVKKEVITLCLKSKLPEYMIPSVIISMDSLPLTSTGKINRKSLEKIQSGYEWGDTYKAPSTEFEIELVSIWQDLLNVENIGIEDNFFERGGHSLLLISLLNRIQKMGYILELKDLFSLQTINELSSYLLVKGNKISVIKKELPKQIKSDNEHLLLLEKGRGKDIIFIIPGSDGISDGYGDLAHAFKDKATVYGIQMLGMYPNEKPLNTIEDIASMNLKWIKEVQPIGPYRFIGHSFGAIVAYEMAKQLEINGEKVLFVCVLDLKPFLRREKIDDRTKKTYILQRLAIILEKYKYIDSKEVSWLKDLQSVLIQIDMEEVMPYLQRFISGKFTHRKVDIEFILQLFSIIVANAFIEYEASGEISCPIIIGKAEDANWEGDSTDLGWGSYSKITQVLTLSGDHFSMVKKGNIKPLASLLLSNFEE